MIFDLVIGTISAIAQFSTAWLGWQITIKPLKESENKRKMTYMSLFIASGLLGIVAV
jgi:hypothetical protein